jgi:hypothetical protein
MIDAGTLGEVLVQLSAISQQLRMSSTHLATIMFVMGSIMTIFFVSSLSVHSELRGIRESLEKIARSNEIPVQD